MSRIISCWALAEKRATHLCAFETLGLNIRCRRPSQEEVRKAWYRLCLRLHPDKNACLGKELGELATEATRCLNLAKDYLFDEHFGNADERVRRKYEKRAAVVVPVQDEHTQSDPVMASPAATAGKRQRSEPPAPEESPATKAASTGAPKAPLEPPSAEPTGAGPTAPECVTQLRAAELDSRLATEITTPSVETRSR